jgi:hypothetical protein
LDKPGLEEAHVGFVEVLVFARECNCAIPEVLSPGTTEVLIQARAQFVSFADVDAKETVGFLAAKNVHAGATEIGTCSYGWPLRPGEIEPSAGPVGLLDDPEPERAPVREEDLDGCPGHVAPLQ